MTGRKGQSRCRTVKNEPKIDADEVLAGIVEWVTIESPSHDAKSVNKVVDQVEGQFRDLGLKLERIPGATASATSWSARRRRR